ncbi:MAG: calcium/sodium antiporter [Verrucomicrobiales bacterium]|nr:calcium/sodium antiporter [Verrucomicrobiales bacterium]
MITQILLLIVGLVLLTGGADILVRGASAIAARVGLSNLVIGLTVVAFGTSAPELAVSLKAALGGTADIAVGNVIGSNIFNIAAILGLSAVICPLVVHIDIIRRDLPVLLAASLAFVVMLKTGAGIAHIEGVLLVTALIVYLVWSIRASRRETFDPGIVMPDAGPPPRTTHIALSISFTLAGLVLLVLGANTFVDNAVIIARHLGLSEAVIGLTIVAGGTSLPELATSLVAACRRQADIAVGNAVGSSIFNILAIAGITSTTTSLSGAGISTFELGAMLLTAALLIPLMRSGSKISRPEGAILLACLATYLYVLWPK